MYTFPVGQVLCTPPKMEFTLTDTPPKLEFKPADSPKTLYEHHIYDKQRWFKHTSYWLDQVTLPYYQKLYDKFNFVFIVY